MHRLSFIRQIAATSENSIQWHALTLAYRSLALVDLLATGTGEADASGVETLLADARSLGEDDPVISRVVVIATLLCARRTESSTAVTIALLDLGGILRRGCQWALALDVSLVALRLSVHDESLAWQSHRLCGWTHRSLGQLGEAEIHYAACIEIGERLNCFESSFWGRNGQCLLVQDRGNLPRAEMRFRRLLEWTQSRARPDLESVARHGLAVTLGLRGRLRESLEHFETALQESPSGEWGRILGNIGYTYFRLGELERARDVFLGIIATVNDSYETFLSHINLIEVYAAVGQPERVEHVRRYLELQPLFPALAIDFQLTLGRAYSTLGDYTHARPCFEKAEHLARQIGHGRAVIEADYALAGLLPRPRGRQSENSQPNVCQSSLDSSEDAAAWSALSRRVHR
jgi:tetratricopeptide (TPR) repeat protein